jgi:histidine ammonia-lyase
MAVKSLVINSEPLSLKQIQDFVRNETNVTLSKNLLSKISKANKLIKQIIDSEQPVYGVNTGFGRFSDIRIDKYKVAELQNRLVFSHAAGYGNYIPREIVRLILLLKAKSLSLGYSGCRIEVIHQLLNLLNHQIVPAIPEKGSVGASGDLAPLAHMALVLMGEGQAFVNESKKESDGNWKLISGKKALKQYGLDPLVLEAKEGLAILNGTQVSTALGLWALIRTKDLLRIADIVGAITLEALLGTLTPFEARIQKTRSHPGQRSVASNFRKILSGSPIVASHKSDDPRVQDAYSLRCIPQVHGAVRDAIEYVEGVLTREINSVTDNPLVFSEKGDVVSGGNFHAAPISYACDMMGIVLTDLSSISERRIEHMQDPNVSQLPGFLTREGGLNSGFMIAHVTAAALTSENKVLAHPASVDSIPTSANKEDHVSMATHAARKAIQIVDNLEGVLSIELISSCQALDLRTPLNPSKVTGSILEIVRSKIPFWKDDRQIYKDINIAKEIIRSGELISVAEKLCGPLS